MYLLSKIQKYCNGLKYFAQSVILNFLSDSIFQNWNWVVNSELGYGSQKFPIQLEYFCCQKFKNIAIAENTPHNLSFLISYKIVHSSYVISNFENGRTFEK